MWKRLMGTALFIVLVILAYSTTLLAQDTQPPQGSELVIPLHSTVNVSTLPPPLPSASPRVSTSEVKPLFTRDPQGLQQWREFLRENPGALPTAPGVITQGPPNALLAPSAGGPSDGLSNQGRSFLFPDPRGLQSWQDFLRENPDALPIASTTTTDTAAQLASVAPLAPSQSTQFDGLSNEDNPRNGTTRRYPPDPNLAIGPNLIFQVVNKVGRITNKLGEVVREFALHDFFPVQRYANGEYWNETDPQVFYDPQPNAENGRWFVTYAENSPPDGKSRGFLAVSVTSDPTGVFCIYNLGNALNNWYEDFQHDEPALGVSDNKVAVAYSGLDFSSGGFVAGGVYVFKKEDVTACRAAASWRSNPDNRFFGLQPAKSSPGTSDLYMVEWRGCVTGDCSLLDLIRLTGDAPYVTWQPAAILTIDTLHGPPPARQKDSDVLLATNDARFLSAAWQNNSLWLAANEACTPYGDTEARSCLRLIEVGTDSLSVRQQMTLGSKGEYFYYPALRPDSSGNLFVVFTASSDNAYAAVRITGRLAVDPVKMLQAVSEIKSGEGPQTRYNELFFQQHGIKIGRMGDYSGAAADPSDPHTVWVMGEYIKAPVPENPDQNWGTWIAKLQPFPSLLLSLDRTPPAYQTGQVLTLTATVNPWPASLATADVYVAVRLPDGSRLYILGDGSLSPTELPYVPNWQISPFSGPIFSYTFMGTEPVGNYAWLGAFATAGSQPPSFIGGIYNAPFSFSP